MKSPKDAHQEIRSEQAQVSGGDSAPFREAIDLLVSTLKRKDLPSLKRLALHTVSRDDDRALEYLVELSHTVKDLQDDQKEARQLLAKYQASLKDLEKLRRKFKDRRYDAPTSEFPRSNLLGTLLVQLVAGMLSSNDVWRQIERAQRTIRRNTGGDFGGIDWGEAMRLPRSFWWHWWRQFRGMGRWPFHKAPHIISQINKKTKKKAN